MQVPGCPSSDTYTNYNTYLVYWWIPQLSWKLFRQSAVSIGGGFTISNIPTIGATGTYTLVVSPYPQNSNQNVGNICVPTSQILTCDKCSDNYHDTKHSDTDLSSSIQSISFRPWSYNQSFWPYWNTVPNLTNGYSVNGTTSSGFLFLAIPAK